MNTEKQNISCIGFILDGNRRWAREQNLPTLEGHKKGYKKLKDTIEWCKETGIKHAVVYIFSTENWNRSEDEVSYLMDLTRKMIKNDIQEIRKEDVALHFIGDLSLYADDIQDMIADVEKTNPSDAIQHVWFAASYGGRAEILAGVNNLLSKGKKNVTETEYEQTLWTAEMPDPDIIVRTGGEKRLSGFLTWSSIYSELFFLDTYWPAFSRKDFDAILEEYAERERRHGR